MKVEESQRQEAPAKEKDFIRVCILGTINPFIQNSTASKNMLVESSPVSVI